MCDSCSVMGSLEKVLYCLNGYWVLVSFVYLLLLYFVDCEKELMNKNLCINDFVYYVFVFNGRMECLVWEEYEFKKDYLNLLICCEEYVVVLLNFCWNMKEIGCLMIMFFIKGLVYV